MDTKKSIKWLGVSLLCVPYLLHLVFYWFSKNKYLIDKDLEVIRQKRAIDYKPIKALVYILYSDIYYRNIFYSRIGWLSRLCSWYLPPSNCFYTCKQMGGGVYPAHPYATILNAKSIGSNFSFRQCTTVGNKADGDNNGPIIGDNVYLGANVCIIGDVKIGNNVIIGAGTVVVKDIPDNVVVVGNPARIINSVDI